MKSNTLIKGENGTLNYLIDLLLESIKKGDKQLENGINNESKTLDRCWQYIMQKASVFLNNKNGAIEDKTVLGWAIHYFTEDDILLEQEVKFRESKEKPKNKKTINDQGIKYTQLSLIDMLEADDV